jgi:hypothetical protein
VVPPLQHIGGRDLNNVEKAAMGALIAAAGVALVIAFIHVASAIASPATFG